MNLLERIEENARRLFALPDNVVFIFNHEFSNTKRPQWGSCCFGDDPTGIIEIFIAPLETIGTLAELLVTICHETIHAQDVLDGRFAAHKAGKKVLYRYENDFFDMAEIEYEKLPWEIKAFSKQLDYLGHFARECDEEIYDLLKEEVE